MSEDTKSAPQPGCRCAVCKWANAIIDRDRRLDADLAENYERYQSGELVSRDGKE